MSIWDEKGCYAIKPEMMVQFHRDGILNPEDLPVPCRLQDRWDLEVWKAEPEKWAVTELRCEDVLPFRITEEFDFEIGLP